MPPIIILNNQTHHARTVKKDPQPVLALLETLQHDDSEYVRRSVAIDFMKSNGKQSRKLFKIGESDYAQTSKRVAKRHSFKSISTRKHYPGEHGFALIVNGLEMASGEFVVELAGD